MYLKPNKTLARQPGKAGFFTTSRCDLKFNLYKVFGSSFARRVKRGVKCLPEYG